MGNKLGQESVHPQLVEERTSEYADLPNTISYTTGGMSQRLLLAGMAMQGLCVGKITSEIKKGEYCDISEMALLIADELLRQEAQ